MVAVQQASPQHHAPPLKKSVPENKPHRARRGAPRGNRNALRHGLTVASLLPRHRRTPIWSLTLAGLLSELEATYQASLRLNEAILGLLATHGRPSRLAALSGEEVRLRWSNRRGRLVRLVLAALSARHLALAARHLGNNPCHFPAEAACRKPRQLVECLPCEQMLACPIHAEMRLMVTRPDFAALYQQHQEHLDHELVVEARLMESGILDPTGSRATRRDMRTAETILAACLDFRVLNQPVDAHLRHMEAQQRMIALVRDRFGDEMAEHFKSYDTRRRLVSILERVHRLALDPSHPGQP